MPRTSDKAVEDDKFIGAVSRALPATTDIEKAVRDRYRDLFEPLVREARPFIGYEAACDAIHDVFLGLISRWKKLKLDEITPDAIARRVRKRVWEVQRRDRGTISLDDEPVRLLIEATVAAPAPPPVDPVTGEPEERMLFQGVFGELTKRELDCWQLMKNRNYSAQEVAEQLGISVNTVYRHIALAKRVLRDRVTANGYKISPETARLLLASRTGENK